MPQVMMVLPRLILENNFKHGCLLFFADLKCSNHWSIRSVVTRVRSPVVASDDWGNDPEVYPKPSTAKKCN
jgi:hypothetical protein